MIPGEKIQFFYSIDEIIEISIANSQMKKTQDGSGHLRFNYGDL